MTAGGGNIIRGEINRNERAPQCGVATIEVAGSEGSDAPVGHLRSKSTPNESTEASSGLQREQSRLRRLRLRTNPAMKADMPYIIY